MGFPTQRDLLAPSEFVQIGAKTPPANLSTPGIRLGDIRPFTCRGKRYVLVIRTTGIFQVSELAWEILRLLVPGGQVESEPPQMTGVAGTQCVSASEIASAMKSNYDLTQIFQAVAELRRMGVLVKVGELPPLRTFLPPPGFSSPPFPQRSLVLNVANDCNLGCTYCFASQGDYGAPKRLMSPEVARKSVDFLLKNSGDHETVTLVFFGGEPLMNFRLIQETVEYAARAGEAIGKKVDFSLTTNATYLNPAIIQFLHEHRIGVSVSIDGPKEFHDLRRTYKNGRGSYDIIEPRIMALLQGHKRRPIVARVTLTHGVTAIQEIFEHLKRMGFDEIGFAPVTSSDRDDYALEPDELWQVLREFQALTDAYVDAAADSRQMGFSNLTNSLADLHHGVVKAYPCGAGLGLLGVGSTGNLYLCHRFLESAEHQVGTLDIGVDRTRQADFLARTHLSAKPPCQRCWVRNICSGGCHHEGYKRYGTLGHANIHYCEWIRTWIDMGLRAYVEIAEKNLGFLDYLEKGTE